MDTPENNRDVYCSLKKFCHKLTLQKAAAHMMDAITGLQKATIFYMQPSLIKRDFPTLRTYNFLSGWYLAVIFVHHYHNTKVCEIFKEISITTYNYYKFTGRKSNASEKVISPFCQSRSHLLKNKQLITLIKICYAKYCGSKFHQIVKKLSSF